MTMETLSEARRKTPEARGLRIFLGVLGVFLTTVGGAFLIPTALSRMELHQQAQEWIATPCEITGGEIERVIPSNNEKTRHQAVIRYRYERHSFVRNGTTIDLWDLQSGSEESATALLNRYPKGTQATCYVDPDNPDNAVLDNSPHPATLVGGIIGVILVFGGMGCIISAIFIVGRNRAVDKSAEQTTNQRSEKNSPPPGCLVAFGAVFLVPGLAALWLFVANPLLMSWQSGNWVPLPCTILSSRVYEEHNKSTTYGVEIRYTYTFQGQTYTSDQYNSQTGTSSGYEERQEVVARYPAGSSATCFVNPERPDEAVLDRSAFAFTTSAVLGVVLSGIFSLIGIALILGGIFGKSTTASAEKEQGPATTEVPPAPVRLDGRLGRGNLISSWVGVVLLAGFTVYIEIVNPAFSSVPIALLTVYVLYRAIHHSLTYGHPRLELVCDPAPSESARKTKLIWKLTPSTRAARAVHLRLMARTVSASKKNVYRRKAHDDLLTTISLPPREAGGSLELEIPAKPSNPKFSDHIVDWSIIARVEVDGFPASQDEFKIEL